MVGSYLSARSEAVTRRTYNRPTDAAGEKFESWEQTVIRSQFNHHAKLWETAGGRVDWDELHELMALGLSRSGLVAGRTLWLGGTDYAYTRAASQFNCSSLEIATVYDIVDAFWLLLNGCGVGGLPRAGTLHGYNRPIQSLRVIPSERDKDFRGPKDNSETQPTAENNWTWTIMVGDSAEAWAKALGKLLISPRDRCDELVLDFSNVRGKGGRLKGYGWICNGYQPFAEALVGIHKILNEGAGNLLDEEQIGDIFNWCGTVLSSRRAAECLLMDSMNPRHKEFSTRKKEYWKGRNHRRQSNNSLLFWNRPSVDDLADLLYLNLNGGEPGFVNAAAALAKCPWFRVFNPCFEICLPSHGFCNLVSLSLPHFKRNFNALERAVYLLARANYRQTCVDLEDAILQKRWNQTNESLRLCGLSLTGIVQARWLTDYQIRRLRNTAITGAYSMADELRRPRPKAVTTVKPEGTRSKIAGTVEQEIAEGMHMPLGRFIFNWINFSNDDPLVGALSAAGYKTLPSPADSNNVLVRFPVQYSGCPFDVVDGKEVNRESAISQLRRYKRWNTLWADHNVSATISLSHEEVPETARWIYNHWDDAYIATAFLPRVDATKTAQDYGHPYLPQEVVTEEVYNDAMNSVRAVDWDKFHTGLYEINDASDCPTGVCPVK